MKCTAARRDTCDNTWASGAAETHTLTPKSLSFVVSRCQVVCGTVAQHRHIGVIDDTA